MPRPWPSVAASRHNVALEIIRTGSRGLYWLESIIVMSWNSALIESRGKCTPCRVGSTQGMEVIDYMIRSENRAASTVRLEDLCDTLKFGSLCALGGFTPYPVTSALTHFPDDFGAPPRLQAGE